MNKLLFLFLLIPSLSFSQMGAVSAHWDIFKGTPIVSFIYQQPIAGGFCNGFVDFYPTPNEPNLVFPPGRFLIFSKHWFAYPVTPTLSLSAEVQITFNVPDSWGRFPTRFTFHQNRFYAMPKIGVTYRLW